MIVQVPTDGQRTHAGETPAIVVRAQTLLRRHALRAGDAIHLASGLHLQDALRDETTFIAFDDRLIAAARLEGLKLG